MIPVELLVGNSVSGGYFSDCRQYRYTLWRRWEPCGVGQMVAFVGLNPSTADEVNNDPTVSRCISFAREWGFQGMIMLNAFAYRATDPRVMKRQDDPTGTFNNEVLYTVTRNCARTVCCWGNHGLHINRWLTASVFISEENRFCFGLTKSNQPKHPLYLKSNTKLVSYRGI